MIKSVDFPNRTFTTKDELFSELKANENNLIDIKKSQIKTGREKGQLCFGLLDVKKATVKGVSFEIKDDYIYPIISTTKFFDSHGDVHLDNSMKKTAKEQNGNVIYALDHEIKYDNVLAWKKDVRMFIAEVDWSEVGKTFKGKTQALVFEIHKDKIRNKQVLSDIVNKVEDFENSIRMIYYKMNLGMNSDNPEFKENKKYYDDNINSIINKEDAEANGYFWGIEELGIHKEGSLVVAGGSNSATSILQKEIEAVEDASSIETKAEPLKDTLNIYSFN